MGFHNQTLEFKNRFTDPVEIMKQPKSINLQKANRPKTPAQYDAALLRCISPAVPPGLDDGDFPRARESVYDTETLRTWSQHFTSPPPPIPNFKNLAEFDRHINDMGNQH